MDIQMNMFRQKADVYDRSQEDVCLEDLDLEITMLSVYVKTMTLGGDSARDSARREKK